MSAPPARGSSVGQGHGHRSSKDKVKEKDKEDKEKASTSSSSSSSLTAVTNADKKEVYEQIKAFENGEAMKMNVALEVDKFDKICRTELAELFTEVAEMKCSGEIDKDLLEEIKLDGLVYMAKLRRMNRFLKFRMRNVKDEALKMRQDVDSDHLVYQNLLYEAIHLNKQVSTIKLYKGKDEEIDLIPTEEFYKLAPKHISKPDLTKVDKHLQKIARLEHEYVLRQELTQSCEALEKDKLQATYDIEALNKKIESVRPMLKNVADSTKPVEEFFGLNTSERRGNFEKSRYLPFCLHQLFHQSIGYQEAMEPKNFKISICGNLEQAVEMIKESENVKSDDKSDKEDSDSDVEKDDEEDKNMSKRRLLSRSHSSFGPDSATNVVPENPKEKIVQIHPMYVEWSISNKDGKSMTIEFHYLMKLQIVLVKAKVHNISTDQLPEKFVEKILDGERILRNLYAGDIGKQSPNPSGVFLLQSFGIPEEEICSVEKELYNKLGRPYYWAQRLSGFDLAVFFPSIVKPSTPNPNKIQFVSMLEKLDKASAAAPAPSSSSSSVEPPKITFSKTLHLIRSRLRNISETVNQISSIESRKFLTQRIPEITNENFFPHEPPTAVLNSWKMSDYDEFISLFEADSVANRNNLYFRADVTDGPLKFRVIVYITYDFPNEAPVFQILMDYGNETNNMKTHNGIRDMESQLNIFAARDFLQFKSYVLPLMLKKFLYMADTFLKSGLLTK